MQFFKTGKNPHGPINIYNFYTALFKLGLKDFSVTRKAFTSFWLREMHQGPGDQLGIDTIDWNAGGIVVKQEI